MTRKETFLSHCSNFMQSHSHAIGGYNRKTITQYSELSSHAVSHKICNKLDIVPCMNQHERRTKSSNVLIRQTTSVLACDALKQEGVVGSDSSLIIITASITCPGLSVQQATPRPTFRFALPIGKEIRLLCSHEWLNS